MQTKYGNVIGGYTQCPWSSDNEYHSDGSAWLFVSRSKLDKLSHFNFPIVFHITDQSREILATYHHPSYLSYFGGGSDLCCYSDCNIKKYSYSLLGSTYNAVIDGQRITKYNFIGNSATNTDRFTVVEIEVYLIK